MSDRLKPPNRKGVRHRMSCLHDEPGVTVCTCDRGSDAAIGDRLLIDPPKEEDDMTGDIYSEEE